MTGAELRQAVIEAAPGVRLYGQEVDAIVAALTTLILDAERERVAMDITKASVDLPIPEGPPLTTAWWLGYVAAAQDAAYIAAGYAPDLARRERRARLFSPPWEECAQCRRTLLSDEPVRYNESDEIVGVNCCGGEP